LLRILFPFQVIEWHLQALVDLIYKTPVDFAESSSDGQKRHIQENISEEKLALFVIAIKPEMALSERKRKLSKKLPEVCSTL